MSKDEIPPPLAPPSQRLWLGLPLLVVGVQIAYYAPRLPERVASHFNMAGEPDGWMSRTAFLGLMGGVAVGLALMFAGITWLVRRLPPSWINLPHREYWLAEPRREASIHAMTKNLLGHALLSLALISWLLHDAYRVNTAVDEAPTLSIWVPVGVYLAGTAILLIRLFRRFHAPETDTHPGQPAHDHGSRHE